MSDAVNALVEKYKQWTIGVHQPIGFVLPKSSFEGPADRNYNLKNTIRKYLQHEKQSIGINLGWTDDASPETAIKVARWFFARNGNSNGPITYGETIALGNGGSPSFLQFDQRTLGINLDWSKTPIFEWKIFGGKVGQPVKTQEKVALFNTKGREFLIHFERDVGAHIGWPSTETFGKQFMGMAYEKAKDAAIAILAS